MIQKVGIPTIDLQVARIESVGKNNAPSEPVYRLPQYTLSCNKQEFVINRSYTVNIVKTRSGSLPMVVNVSCVGGIATLTSFSTEEDVTNIIVKPISSPGPCRLTFTCEEEVVGEFEMQEVLTVPAYTLSCEDRIFTQEEIYSISISRITAPIKRMQIDVECIGGTVSLASLVDEGGVLAFDNKKIDVTPNAETCTVVLKCTLDGQEYRVGQYMMNNVKSPYSVSTIRINQNISDPNTMITGDVNGDAIKAIRTNSHIYLGKYTGGGEMTICQLSDVNSNYYHDGSNAMLTGEQGDVFMRLPRFYTLANEVERDIWDISFAYGKKPSDAWHEWGGDDLIGVYKSGRIGYGIYSISNIIPAGFNYHEDAVNYAQNRGNGYNLVGFRHHNIMAFLFMAIYGTTDSQATCGSGIPGYRKLTGSNDTLGMTDTTSEDNGIKNVKFWGLENWWSDSNEFIYDMYVGNGVCLINDEDHKNMGIPINAKSGYISKIRITNNLEALPTVTKLATSTTMYCDYLTHIINSIGSAVCRSGASCNANNGIFCLNMNISQLDNAEEKTSSRLCFRGTLIEQKNVEAFKAIPITN